uniref:Uncharacterized protein n=1 Tax=Arundo donax TaxID=35708 RepID=A0A0A9BCP8_ARUDO
MEVLVSLQLPAAYAPMRPNISSIMAASSAWRLIRRWLCNITMITSDATKAAELQ